MYVHDGVHVCIRVCRYQPASQPASEPAHYFSLRVFFFQFHWLKVRERIEYKLLLTVHKYLHEQAPKAFSGLLTYGESERMMKLHERKSRTKYGDRAFSHAGPKFWNFLPWHLRDQHETLIFKKELKSFLMLNGEDFHRKINVH